MFEYADVDYRAGYNRDFLDRVYDKRRAEKRRQREIEAEKRRQRQKQASEQRPYRHPRDPNAHVRAYLRHKLLIEEGLAFNEQKNKKSPTSLALLLIGMGSRRKRSSDAAGREISSASGMKQFGYARRLGPICLYRSLAGCLGGGTIRQFFTAFASTRKGSNRKATESHSGVGHEPVCRDV